MLHWNLPLDLGKIFPVSILILQAWFSTMDCIFICGITNTLPCKSYLQILDLDYKWHRCTYFFHRFITNQKIKPKKCCLHEYNPFKLVLGRSMFCWNNETCSNCVESDFCPLFLEDSSSWLDIDYWLQLSNIAIDSQWSRLAWARRTFTFCF